ncbi:hypothetical protein [Micromonospora sp. NPDC023633]|uniref:hypothetical protein n=1 Tax=Micromonospora sp. NPDC023633 TaxID=3154320 RepID=UPI0033EF72BB
MRTYADLFAVREFRNLFLANCAGIAAHTTSALALGALTYASSGSALLTALSMFGAPLAGVLGSLTLLSAADSVPPRRALTLAAVLVAAGAALQAVPGLPLWARFAVIFAGAYVGSITAGARWALLTDILPADAYVLGRSTMNTSVGAMQIAGFGLVVAIVASAGFAAGLPLQERLIVHSPAEIRGQVLGLHHNGMLTTQALCAVLAGTVADLVPASWAVALLAAASLAATLVLTAGLRRTAPAPAEAVR